MINIFKKINNIIKSLLIIILINNSNNYRDNTVCSIFQNKNLENILSDNSNKKQKNKKKIANFFTEKRDYLIKKIRFIKNTIIIKKINILIKSVLIILLLYKYFFSKIYSIPNNNTNNTDSIIIQNNNTNNTDSIIIQNNNNSNIKYKNLEDLLSDDSSESIKIRKKIANVLSKKRNYLINNLGIIDSILLIPSFLFLDKKFNRDHLSQNEKQEVIKTYNEFSNEVKTAMLEILNKEVFNNNHIK